MNDELEKAKAEAKKKEPTGEMIDRAERRRVKDAKKKAKADKKKTAAPVDEIDQAMASGKMAEKKKAARKKQFKTGMMIAGIALVGYGGFYLFKPFEESRTFAVCKIFLENQVRYPKYLRLSTVETPAENTVRIWYTKLDPFGEYRMENIECKLDYTEELGTHFSKITIDRREVDPDKVAAFNRILPMFRDVELDLTKPQKLPDSLRDLQIDTDAFRFQLNIPGLN